MVLFVRDWLGGLKKYAKGQNIEHLDVVINATLLDDPLLQRLAGLDPPPPQALRLEGTPEYALAVQGSVLIRVLWEHASQVAWLGEFHTAAINWYWIAHDRKAQAIGGDQRKLYEFARPQTPLMLDQRQMESIRARTKGEQWEDPQGLTRPNYSVSKEQRIAHIHLGLIVRDDKHLKGKEHTAFTVEWLAPNLPEDLLQTGGLA